MPSSSGLRSKLFAALCWVGNQLFPLLVIVWINGVILRVTLRDSVEMLAPLYYATPWPVLATLTLPFVWTFRKNPKGVFAVIVVAHLFFGAWLMEGWRTGDPSRDPADLRVVQWNVSRPGSRFSARQSTIAARLRSFDADLLSVSEPLPVRDRNASFSDRMRDRWSTEFPGYAAEFTGDKMLLLVRGTVAARETVELTDGSVFSRYDVEVKGHAFRVIQADVTARPTRSRRLPLSRLSELVASSGDGPVIVLGDFNTPRDSVHLEPLRKQLTNTFEVAGTGCGDTWPSILPVLSLDQIWCGRGLKPVRCSHGVTFRSDHRPVLAELTFSP